MQKSYRVLVVLVVFRVGSGFLRWWIHFGHVKIHVLLQFQIAWKKIRHKLSETCVVDDPCSWIITN